MFPKYLLDLLTISSYAGFGLQLSQRRGGGGEKVLGPVLIFSAWGGEVPA